MEKNTIPGMNRSKGFTLIELMIVVVVVAILAAFAYPAYQDYVLRSNRANAKGELLEVASLQEQYFANNKEYTGSLSDLGYSNPHYIDGRGDPSSAGQARYVIDITTNANGLSYGLRATPQNMQTDDTLCNALGVDDRGRKFKQVTNNALGVITGTASDGECW
jgi:type IV pilus assembly protein PilE